MPAAHPSLALLIVLPFVLDACGGDDLTLPGDNAPASLKLVSGDGQQGRPGELLDDPLVVQLANSHGEPTPGILVSFSGSAGGVEVAPGLDTTDEQGRAAAQARLGQTEGEQAVEAIVVGGRDLSVEFSVTAIPDRNTSGPEPDPGGGAGGGGGNDQSGGDDGNGGKGGGGGGDDHGKHHKDKHHDKGKHHGPGDD
jgi:hypothetical protein